MNQFQSSFLKRESLSLSTDTKSRLLKELYEHVPSLTHPYRVFGPFKRKVLSALKHKTLTPVNKKTIKLLKPMIVRGESSDIGSYVTATGLGFTDSIILARETKSSFLLDQLLWRTFYYQADIDDPELRRNIWKVNKRLQHKFFTGRTGFPLIDASVNCLVHTGKLANKLRMLLATFFCKNMRQPWMTGEKFFAKYLEDYDRVINRGNWIWCSQLRYDNQQFIRFLHPHIQLKILLKTANGVEWFDKWKKPECEEMLNWEESCKSFREWKINLK